MQKIRQYLAQGRRSLYAAFTLLLFYALVIQAVFYLRTSAQAPPVNARPTPTDTPAGKPLAADNPWKDYFEAVSKERELVQTDAKANLERMERLQDRILLFTGGLGALLLGFIYFLFGQTKEQVQAQLREDVRERIREDVERALAEARARIREDVEREIKAQFAAEIKKTVGDFIESHYKTQPIRWVAAEESATVREVTQALQTLKFTNVQRVAPDKLEEAAGARVVIFAYGKVVKPGGLTEAEKASNESALEQLRQVAAWVRRQPVPLPLVIHAESNNAIQAAEKEALQGIVNVPANFASTIITQTLTLLHR